MTENSAGYGACGQKTVTVPHMMIEKNKVISLLRNYIREAEVEMLRAANDRDYGTAYRCDVVIDELAVLVRRIERIEADK